MCKGVFKKSFRSKFVSLLEKLPITDFQKETIKSRFVVEVCDLEDDYNRSIILFVGLTNLVTVSGILITSFTTLTKAISVDPYWQNVLSWMVWTLSILLTLANGWLTTFGIYKKYVLNDATLEKMYNEGWSFIAGVNRYEGKTDDEKFAIFCSKIEQVITRTTIKQLADNTAGVNVHDVMEVPQEEANDKSNQPDDNISAVNSAENGRVNSGVNNIENTENTKKEDVSKDVVIDIVPAPKDPVYRPRKKKIRK